MVADQKKKKKEYRLISPKVYMLSRGNQSEGIRIISKDVGKPIRN